MQKDFLRNLTALHIQLSCSQHIFGNASEDDKLPNSNTMYGNKVCDLKQLER